MIALALLMSSALSLSEPATKPARSALDCHLANVEVEAAIARKVKSLNGIEYCQFRNYEAMSDLDGDGRDDLVVSFNVEPASGGNDHDGYLAVFLSSDAAGAEPPIVRTGGRGERDVDGIQVQGKRILLQTLEYLPDDAMCCPSGHGEIGYELRGRTLKPLPQTQAKGD